MSADKESFVARYGDIDIDKEFSPENPEPNVHAIRRPEATHAHALKLLYHPNGDKAVFALSMRPPGTKTRMVKRSDLENYSGGSPVVKTQIKALFHYEGMAKKMTKSMHFTPYYPEDKE